MKQNDKKMKFTEQKPEKAFIELLGSEKEGVV